MSWEQTKVEYFSQSGTSANDQTINFEQKPIEIYYYIDPLCPKSWSLEPYLKKLAIQYGRYFTIRPIIAKRLFTMNKSFITEIDHLNEQKLCNNSVLQTENEYETLSPWTIALAIKAAELQGKSAGRTFLRKVQQALFLKDVHFSDVSLLYRCAKVANIDVAEFKKDLNSAMARKALLCDLRLANEMNVQQAPTIVFFNSLLDEQGIKVSGLYSYDIYTHVLIKTLKDNPIPDDVPELEVYIAKNEVVTTEEISIIYDWSLKKAENELKKLKLQQIVEKQQTKNNAVWKVTISS